MLPCPDQKGKMSCDLFKFLQKSTLNRLDPSFGIDGLGPHRWGDDTQRTCPDLSPVSQVNHGTTDER